MPPLPSSLKNSVQFGLVPLRVQVIMKMLLWLLRQLISKHCNLPAAVLFLPNYSLFYCYFTIPCFSVDLLPWFVHIWELPFSYFNLHKGEVIQLLCLLK